MPPKKQVVQEKVLLGRPGNNLKSGIVCELGPHPFFFFPFFHSTVHFPTPEKNYLNPLAPLSSHKNFLLFFPTMID